MGLVYDQGGFRVWVYAPPREHRPAHVHVECANGGEVIVKLGDDRTPPSVWAFHHVKSADMRRALRIVEGDQELFLEEWRKLHGP